ncbi:MAG: FtsX-like permease family protein, partial [Terriglobales bacterium]
SRLRPLLLVAELALALVLVVAGGLLLRSFGALLRTDPGFQPRRAAAFELTLPSDAYAQPAAMVRFYHDVLEQLGRLPQVEAAGLAAVPPLGGATNSTAVRLPGRAPAPPDHLPFANYTIVSSGYFAAAGTPILRGRDFSPADTAQSLPVAIISAAMAAHYWPGRDPIGQQVGPASPRLAALTIVGVAADVKRQSLEEQPAPEMYVLYNQNPWPSMQTMDVVVRGRGDAGTLQGALAGAVHRVDPQVPLARRTTLEALEDQALAGSDFLMWLMLGFGGMATFTAMLGLYSVIAFEVQRRSPELAIRLALGATPQAVRRGVLRQGGALAGAGIACGLGAAWVLTRLMSGELYGVAPTDAATFAWAAGLLMAVALAASYLPARRAARLDPLRLLRCE